MYNKHTISGKHTNSVFLCKCSTMDWLPLTLKFQSHRGLHNSPCCMDASSSYVAKIIFKLQSRCELGLSCLHCFNSLKLKPAEF